MNDHILRILEADQERIIIRCAECGQKAEIRLDWKTKTDANHQFALRIGLIQGVIAALDDHRLEVFKEFLSDKN